MFANKYRLTFGWTICVSQPRSQKYVLRAPVPDGGTEKGVTYPSIVVQSAFRPPPDKKDDQAERRPRGRPRRSSNGKGGTRRARNTAAGSRSPASLPSAGDSGHDGSSVLSWLGPSMLSIWPVPFPTVNTLTSFRFGDLHLPQFLRIRSMASLPLHSRGVPFNVHHLRMVVGESRLAAQYRAQVRTECVAVAARRMVRYLLF